MVGQPGQHMPVTRAGHWGSDSYPTISELFLTVCQPGILHGTKPLMTYSRRVPHPTRWAGPNVAPHLGGRLKEEVVEK
jgi:hypothetical protein